MNGFINLNKPKGLTSHDCVAKLRKILHTKKIGHGGTLDPLATGVLPIAVGKATRLLQFLPTKKAYRAKIRFGVATTTDDLEGDIIATGDTEGLNLAMIEPYLPEFIGKISQTPPIYSALKRDGKKLYELARKGEDVDIPSRIIEIFDLKILAWQNSDFPELDLDVVCGAGTYIRALARDLGNRLGCGATLAGLERTMSCNLLLDNSVSLEDLQQQKEKGNLALIPMDKLLSNLDTIYLNQEDSQKWCWGQKLVCEKLYTEQFYLTYNQDQEFVGITEIREENQQQLIKPKVSVNNG